jgi:hypothetical protein
VEGRTSKSKPSIEDDPGLYIKQKLSTGREHNPNPNSPSIQPNNDRIVTISSRSSQTATLTILFEAPKE